MKPLRVPAVLRRQLGDPAVSELSDMIEQTIERAEERFDRRLKEECGNLRIDMANLRADLIKWSFLFWTGQIVTIAALLALMR